MGFFAMTGNFLKKEWWLGWSQPAHFFMPFLFCATLVTLMSLLVEPPLSHRALISSMWLALLFAGILRFVKGGDPENESQVHTLYRLNPRTAVPFFVAKLLMNFVYLFLLLLVSYGLFVLFHPLAQALSLFAGILIPMLLWLSGFCVLGTLFSNMLLGYERRDATLALLLYPFLMPAVVALIKSFSFGTEGELIGIAASWLYFLALFDGIFLLMSLYAQELLFE